jgi:sec-independent protein translocase protein TatB
MFNVGGGELLVIFLVALIVLGPAKLPEVARQVGGVMREIRRISSGFQDEMRAAMDDPVEAAARERGNRVVATSESPAPANGVGDELDEHPDHPEDDDLDNDAVAASEPVADDEADAAQEAPPMSTAAAAGMYDVAPPTSTPNPYRTPVGTRAQPVDADDPITGGADTDTQVDDSDDAVGVPGEAEAPVEVDVEETGAGESDGGNDAEASDSTTGER